MTTTSNYSPELLEDRTVVDSEGDSVGKVGQVYLDNRTGQPSWVTVETGWFGTNESFVPLSTATLEDDIIRVPYTKQMIKDAPNYDIGVPLTQTDEDGLYSYYGITDEYDQVGYAGDGTGTSSATRQDANYLTRSEEQLHVGTEKVETGRARLRKFVVTENQTVTVPISHEEVRVVREPIGPRDTVEDADIGDEATEIVLTEERVIVNKQAVPMEKVLLDTETVTEQREVTEPVRKEHIEFDDAATTAGSVRNYEIDPDDPIAN
jgi:uncharacterized protein (TIGR02271 family)